MCVHGRGVEGEYNILTYTHKHACTAEAQMLYAWLLELQADANIKYTNKLAANKYSRLQKIMLAAAMTGRLVHTINRTVFRTTTVVAMRSENMETKQLV